jgi:tetratricopeptide (TPR) repeat protein
MKHSPVFLAVALGAFCFTQPLCAQGDKEANRLAREGSDAAKEQDWDKAIESLRKANNLDHKYAPNLAAAYQQRATASANDRRFPDAIEDFGEAIKLSPRDAGIYERRAAVEMKINDMDKALADYGEAIKISPREVRYYLYRGYVYESKGDLPNSMADTERVLKIDKKNAEALARKTRLETRMKMQKDAAQNAATPQKYPPPAPNQPK